MQENRSFDHYFGTMAGVRGFGDDKALKLPNGKSVFYQPDPENPNGYLLPFHLDTRTHQRRKSPRPATPGRCSTPPGTAARWTTGCRPTARPTAPRRPTSWAITRATDIPFQFALAEAFTICDAYHCSLMGPTWPNRMYWMTGTIDPDGEGGGPVTSNQTSSGAVSAGPPTRSGCRRRG